MVTCGPQVSRIVGVSSVPSLAPGLQAGDLQHQLRKLALRKVPPVIRLQSLDAFRTRAVVYTLYLVLAGAITMAALSQTEVDRGSTPLNLGAATTRLGPPAAPGNISWHWTSSAASISSQASQLAVSLQLLQPGAAASGAGFKTAISVELQGAVPGSSGKAPTWVSVAALANATLALQCQAPASADSAPCLLPLLQQSQLSSAGGFDMYRVQLRAATNLTAAAQAVRGVVSYQFPVYRWLSATSRALLCLGTLAITVLWYRRISQYDAGMLAAAQAVPVEQRKRAGISHASPWIAHRRYMFRLLIAVVLWQNPLYIATFPMSSPPAGLVLAAECLQATAWAVILGLWLVSLKALQFVTAFTQFRVPRTFYLREILFVVGLALVDCSIQVLRLPEVAAYLSVHSQTLLLHLTVGLAASFSLLLLLWVVWYAVVARFVGQALAKLPYGLTRFQQLLYRVSLWQQSVIIMFVIGVHAVPVIAWIHDLVSDSHGGVASSSPQGGIVSSPAAQTVATMQRLSNGPPPMSEVLLMVAYVWILAYCFLPPVQLPQQPTAGGASAPPTYGTATPAAHGHYLPLPGTPDAERAASISGGMAHPAERSALQRGLLAVADTLSTMEHALEEALGSTAPEEVAFSLSSTCWLFDLAWCAYFDPASPKLAERVPNPIAARPAGATAAEPHATSADSTPSTMERDVSPSAFAVCDELPHGFELVEFIYNAHTDIACTVAVRGPVVVVAFRGTASRKNISTDLQFSQIDWHALGEHASFMQAAVSAVPGLSQLLPRVHRGFFAAYCSVRQRVVTAVATAVMQAGPDARVFCTGHSLGGALASLAAMDIVPSLGEVLHAASVMGDMVHSTHSARTMRELRPSKLASASARLDALSARLDMSAIELGGQSDRARAAARHSTAGARARTASLAFAAAAPSDATASRDANAGADLWQSASSNAKQRPHAGAAAGHAAPRAAGAARSAAKVAAGTAKSPAHAVALAPTTPRSPHTLEDALVAGPGAAQDAAAQWDGTGPDPGVGITQQWPPPAPRWQPPPELHLPWRQTARAGQLDVRARVMVVSFGAPRVGNYAFSRAYDVAVPLTYRIVYDGDAIAAIPKWTYKHHGVLVRVDGWGSVTVAPTFVETTFARSGTSLAAHSMLSYRRALLNARLIAGLPLDVQRATSAQKSTAAT